MVSWAALAVSVGICLAVAVLEHFLTGDGIKTWYTRLRKPRWQIPMWAFIIVGILVYIIDGFVAYRVLTAVTSWQDRIVALTALVVVMALNALWSYAFFEYQSTVIGFPGLIALPGPLIILQTALFAYDILTMLVHTSYVLWLVAYDLPLFYALRASTLRQPPDR